MSSKLVMPSEFDGHEAVWMAWPYRDDEWADLAAAQTEILALIDAISETEEVRLLVHPETSVPKPIEEGEVKATVIRETYGDAWTRDTCCIFVRKGTTAAALVFGFNGWGGKYEMPGDEDLALRLANRLGVETVEAGFVLEGGAIEVDGEGTLLTTRDCIANANRFQSGNLVPDLKRLFGVDRVVVIEGCLENDHTDGHIDTIARFVKPGHVLCMASEPTDPNHANHKLIETGLRDAGFEVSTIPSPGEVRDADGELLAASYCNYYVANGQILIPTYGVDADEAAIAAIAALFPEHRCRGLSARAIIEGGGAFHCITQQQPKF